MGILAPKGWATFMRGGTFVTADQRHFSKARHFGHIELLGDWRPG